jgi:hypothetical protein
MKTHRLYTDIEEEVARLEEQRKQNSKRFAEQGVTKPRPLLDVKTAAIRFGRKEDYWTYWWPHESGHGSDAARMYAKRKFAENSVDLNAPTNDPTVRSGVALFAARSVVTVGSATSTIFGWTLAPGLEQTVSEIEQMLGSNAG